jgi:hypothetical protein
MRGGHRRDPAARGAFTANIAAKAPRASFEPAAGLSVAPLPRTARQTRHERRLSRPGGGPWRLYRYIARQTRHTRPRPTVPAGPWRFRPEERGERAHARGTAARRAPPPPLPAAVRRTRRVARGDAARPSRCSADRRLTAPASRAHRLVRQRVARRPPPELTPLKTIVAAQRPITTRPAHELFRNETELPTTTTNAGPKHRIKLGGPGSNRNS